MTRIKIFIALAALLLSSLACAVLSPATPTPTTVPPTDTSLPPTDTSLPPTDTSMPPTDTPSGPTATPGECTITFNSDVTIYNRPYKSAQEFSTQGAGFSTQVYARTADGWYGFDPGVAQAANIGVFRLRWIDSGDDVTLSGDCEGQPLVVPPEPTLCYEMPMSDVSVYTTPATSSAVVATLHVEDYAAITGKTSAEDWFMLDLAHGNTGLAGSGWIEANDLNMNGPTCDAIPVATP